MSAEQLTAWITVGQVLVNAGIQTAETIKGWFAAQSTGMTDAELNAVLDAIYADAERRKDLAAGDAQPPAA